MALTALCRPSVYWAVFMPVIVMMLSVFGMCRAVSLPSKRVFWSSFLAGLWAYGASVVAIRILFKIWSENFDWTPQLEFWENSYGKHCTAKSKGQFTFQRLYDP
jgi:hypothetical protein